MGQDVRLDTATIRASSRRADREAREERSRPGRADEPHTELDEIALAQRNPRAFAPLYERYVDAIFGYCYRRTSDREAAADLTSQIFARALASLPRYRSQAREGTFRSWLFSIAHNLVIDAHRTRRDHHSLDRVAADLPLRDTSPSPEDHALAGEDRRELARAMATLTGGQRQVVELRLAGLTGPEIAAVLGCGFRPSSPPSSAPMPGSGTSYAPASPATRQRLRRRAAHSTPCRSRPMPDTSPHDNHVRQLHSDLPPPGSRKGSSDAMERFADALDGLVLGARALDMHDASERSLAHLAITAGEIQRRHGTAMTAHGPVAATPIGETRKRQIWEDLMSQCGPETSPTIAPTAHASTIGRLGALMQPWVAIDDERPARDRRASTGLLRFIPDPQPVTTFALVIAVLIAVGAGFSTIVEPGGPGVTPTASAAGLAGRTGQTGSATSGSPAAAQATVPAAVPTADPSDEFQRPLRIDDSTCAIEPRPLDEIAAILRDPGPVTPRAYLPATTPDPAVAEEVARAGRIYMACRNARTLNVDRALETPRFIYEDRANVFLREAGGEIDYEDRANVFLREAGGEIDTATREERERLAFLVLGQDPRANQLLVTELAISREEAELATPSDPPRNIVPPATPDAFSIFFPEQLDRTIRPEQAVQLADGRIAAPLIYLVDPSEVGAWLSVYDTEPIGVTILIFATDATRDGQWGLDEWLNVCLGSDLCDELYAAEDLANDALFPAPATPAAPPAATSPARGRSRSIA